MSDRQLSIQIVLCNVKVSTCLHEVSSLAYCPRCFRLSLGEMLWLFITTVNEVRLCFDKLINKISFIVVKGRFVGSTPVVNFT